MSFEGESSAFISLQFFKLNIVQMDQRGRSHSLGKLFTLRIITETNLIYRWFSFQNLVFQNVLWWITPAGGSMCVHAYVHAQLLSCVRVFWDPMDCSPPGPSVGGIFQVRILEWVARPSPRGSSRPGDRVHAVLRLLPQQEDSSLRSLGSPHTVYLRARTRLYSDLRAVPGDPSWAFCFSRYPSLWVIASILVASATRHYGYWRRRHIHLAHCYLPNSVLTFWTVLESED